MSHLPLTVRIWAAICHLNAFIWIPFLFFQYTLHNALLQLAPLPPGVSICLVRPHAICNAEVRYMLFVVMLIQLTCVCCLPFISVVVTLFLWKIKKNTDFFIYQHGKEALKFQLELAYIMIILHVICILILMILNSLTAGGLLVIMILDVYVFPILVILQSLKAVFCSFKALNGGFIRYNDIVK
ncbi:MULTISPECIES: DUF4870 domain-containing protein [Nostocales]|uniref:DUF4870 domain-containing protein n=1 Tax=Nostoc spongiaeforme FACHB-130 TaxID=1357510 RepID=A0ABR8FW89_9NOSO|nr:MULTISPECIES: DUF4870 domain-containing protein [Nostocales]MBD2487353.1 DUF4870 domain-containing protein [Aulosira sp. FACHB-615]MBD2595695.1 DUF4870 domain-containing protein [Nostoc spongiaeforme FACHB-130]